MIHYQGFAADKKNDTADALDAFCQEHSHRCLTPAKWDVILQFVLKANARLVFCLNYLGHTTRVGGRINGKGDITDWDGHHQAQSLLRYTAQWQQKDQTNLLYGLELGDEVTHRGKAHNLTRYRRTYETVKRIVDEI